MEDVNLSSIKQHFKCVLLTVLCCSGWQQLQYLLIYFCGTLDC